MNEPIMVMPHQFGGTQRIYKFENGYGASVVRFYSFVSDTGYGSYTSNENEWELAVIKFIGDSDVKFELVYDTPITDDVIGHLTEEELQKVLEQIKKLKTNEKNENQD